MFAYFDFAIAMKINTIYRQNANENSKKSFSCPGDMSELACRDFRLICLII